MKSGKRKITEWIELPNPEKIRTIWGKEIFNYLEVLEADTIRQADMKEKIRVL